MKTVSLEKYSPPGYFDLSDDKSEASVKIFEWFKNVRVSLQNQPSYFDFFYRLFLSVNYTENISTDFLLYMAKQYGLENISLPTNRMKDLLIYVSTPKEKKLSDNIQKFIDFLFSQEWISSFGDAIVGYNSRSNFAETLIIFYDLEVEPATPDNTPYTPLNWTAPEGWEKFPLYATFYCRGYLYEGEIIWNDPLPTSTVVMYNIVDDLASLPLFPTEGDICLVVDDGSTDFQSVYYFNGFYWKKNSTPNANQKKVSDTTALHGSEVFAPDNALISSNSPPPDNGYSEGYGFYGIFGQGSLVNRISFRITLTDTGFPNLGLIVQLIKKVKPLGNLLIVYAVYQDQTYLLEINDINAL